MTAHKTRSFERPKLPVFQESCGKCGWAGPEQSFRTITTWQLETHECREVES